jgi:hypothetical protein
MTTTEITDRFSGCLLFLRISGKVVFEGWASTSPAKYVGLGSEKENKTKYYCEGCEFLFKYSRSFRYAAKFAGSD